MLLSLLETIGLIRILRLHPLWNTEFQRQFGRAGIVVFVAIVCASAVFFPFLEADYELHWFAAGGLLGFTVGVVPTMIVCTTARLVGMMMQGKIQTPWLWVAVQVTGVASIVAGVMVESGSLRFLPLRQTQGFLLVILGLATLWISTSLVWRRHFPPVL